ncbi:DUF1559 domain-containing protein [Gimesia sp.]|uniref:DUF1559 family PulG-like putative transporter n=1 Tax=Gimesia sp. TaxID=2024833 RepID=UPI0032ECF77B
MQSGKRKNEICQRWGFTWVELLITLAVITLLGSLSLSAIQRTRNSSKRLSCLNNLRNVGLAAINYSSEANAHLPPLVSPNQMNGPGKNAGNDDMSLFVMILPYLDQVAFYQRWELAAYVAAGETSAAQQHAKADLDRFNAAQIPVFVCPDDSDTVKSGGLSYCANIGYVTSHYNSAADTSHVVDSPDGGFDADPDNDTDLPVKFASGVFWRPWKSGMSLDYIAAADGLTQTLMLSENLQAGKWSSIYTGDLGFGVDVEGILTGPSLKLPADFNLKTDHSDSRIDANHSAGEGQAWRPSSNHPSGAVNVILCDGSGRSLSPKMDPRVYARLLTPAGLRHGQDVVAKSGF